ncbi:hypothetical protein M8Z33_17055 [Streptomyces sp. ZAF1911]|uniref:hypothetical protein n=1 Tax=Streptomyces sp. ZAF1911 TaxID=2944129 RepID=UPI00237ABFCF|nr:hypothetical protein [Streptomyces sp. ZAF1911]MDD9378334.1 hypothetical protein [Streptomyces sp. ZAF1911]
MDHSGTVDQDDIVRARNVLLSSGRLSPRDKVDAYRVLAQVSPAAYLPLLARALQHLSYQGGRRHPAALALCEEAVAAARSIDPAEPARADVLYEALNTCQRELYGAGRRAEGLAMRAEMLAIGRAQAELAGERLVAGLETWAAGLSEEGRYAEAADAMSEEVAALLPDGSRSGALAWSLLEWIAVLHEAGRSGEALDAFETLCGLNAAEAAGNDRDRMIGHLHTLIGYARMLDAHGRDERAGLVWEEALALLTELAGLGERYSAGGYETAFWSVLLSMPGAGSDRPAPGEPRPPSGADPMRWSPDTKERWFESRHALREEVDALAARAGDDPDRHLAELVRLHRVLTVRSTVYWRYKTHLFAEPVRPLFHEGVDLARRLSLHDPAAGARILVGSLIDRSAFHVAVGELGPALEDFREALGHPRAAN